LGKVTFHITLITPKFLVVFWAAAVLAAVLSRVVMRLFLAQVRLHGRNLRDMLIIGTNPRGLQFARTLRQ